MVEIVQEYIDILEKDRSSRRDDNIYYWVAQIKINTLKDLMKCIYEKESKIYESIDDR